MSYRELMTEVSCNVYRGKEHGGSCEARVIYMAQIHKGDVRSWLTSLGWTTHKSPDTGLETDICPRCTRAQQVKTKEKQEQWATKSSRCSSS